MAPNALYRYISIHVPRGIAEEVKAWSREHKRLKRLCREISELGERIIRLHVKTERASAKNRSRASGILQE